MLATVNGTERLLLLTSHPVGCMNVDNTSWITTAWVCPCVITQLCVATRIGITVDSKNLFLKVLFFRGAIRIIHPQPLGLQ